VNSPRRPGPNGECDDEAKLVYDNQSLKLTTQNMLHLLILSHGTLPVPSLLAQLNIYMF